MPTRIAPAITAILAAPNRGRRKRSRSTGSGAGARPIFERRSSPAGAGVEHDVSPGRGVTRFAPEQAPERKASGGSQPASRLIPAARSKALRGRARRHAAGGETTETIVLDRRATEQDADSGRERSRPGSPAFLAYQSLRRRS
jgi:hypothetical protein